MTKPPKRYSVEMGEKLVSWGICSAGKICSDFTAVLMSLPSSEHQVKAVASSSKERAEQFAQKFSIGKSYGSYQQLADDTEIDVVYIGSLNTQHYEHTKLMLNAGKAVLCEKPFCLYPKQYDELFNLAKEKNVFLMEGIWSRFFPAYAAVRKAIDSGEIGEVRMLQGAFGDNVSEDSVPRVFSKGLGGGALFDIGIYLLQLSQFIFQQTPDEIHGSGCLNAEGVDTMVGITMKYPGNKIASLVCSTISTFSNDATVCGTKGFIRIHSPFWCPTAITVNGKVVEFPLPKVASPMNFRNSEGFAYEAQEVRGCLVDKLLESPAVTHVMSIELSKITEALRKKVGHKIAGDY